MWYNISLSLTRSDVDRNGFFAKHNTICISEWLVCEDIYPLLFISVTLLIKSEIC